MSIRLSFLALLCTALLMAGCRSGSSGEEATYEAVLIEGIPHVRQKPDFCGEACAEMVLRELGHDTDQDAVFDLACINPARGRGAITPELKVALEELGFIVGQVWYYVAVKNVDAELEALWAELHIDLLAGHPSIVCTRFDDREGASEHFRLVLGYDPDRDEVVYHDPALDEGALLRMKRRSFLDLWPLKYKDDEWTVIRFRMQPGNMRPPPATDERTAADYAQHIRALRSKVPPNFTTVVEPPFVVIGDQSAQVVKSHSRDTVRSVASALRKQFFHRDPEHIVDIWLFENAESYKHHAYYEFGETPATPYGYVTDNGKTLLMDISTGSGTLVHEMVHPYMRANFPTCPPWFDEGLASLFEQCSLADGTIRGYTNWRLDELQTAIRHEHLPSLETLMAYDVEQFYGDHSSQNYAQARYLLYYLQEHEQLVPYYREFLSQHAQDPDGIASLKKILGHDDLEGFQKEWESYVTALRFEP